MRTFELVSPHQGFEAGTRFDGPRSIPYSIVETNTGKITHAWLKTGYYPSEGTGINGPFCFYADFVESNPDLFKEIKENVDKRPA